MPSFCGHGIGSPTAPSGLPFHPLVPNASGFAPAWRNLREASPVMESMRTNPSADRGFRRGILMLLLIAMLGSLVIGCAGGRIVSPGITYDSPDAALRSLAASGPPGTITATARIAVTHRGERYALKAAMMMRRPANLRLESIPLLGPPDFFLSVEGGELRAFLPGKGAFYIGPATSGNISRFLPLPLSGAEIIPLLMGLPPEERETSDSRRGEREEGLYRVDEYTAGRKVRSLWIDPAAGLLIRVRTFTEGGGIAYTADFADHTRVGGAFMPQRLTLSGEAVSLVLSYADIRPLDVDTASFALPVPEGIIPIPLQGL
jgi:hypothetical protein